MLTTGSVYALNDCLHSFGYHAVLGNNDLCAIILNEVNAVLVATNGVADNTFRVQRLAVQIAEPRLLIRHRHAHSSSSAARKAFDAALKVEDAGSLVVDIGEFNELPVADHSNNRFVLFPTVGTFRRDPSGSSLSSTIDGAVVTSQLMQGAQVSGLQLVHGIQHRPVLVQLGPLPSFHNTYQWAIGDASVAGPWDQHM